ncbi:MAG: hypothetical protein SynsKO_10140 [Synoicihabitans sp.]
MKNANPVSRWLGGVLFALGLVFALGCAQSEPAAPVEPKTVKDWFEIEVGEVAVSMQLAVTPPEMQQGLMGRRDLQRGQGMLFIYPFPTQMSFWMRNTPTALDIGFFTPDGVLREIYPLHPFDERSVRSTGDDLQYALELLQGGFADLGIKPGMKLDLAAVKSALVERGFEPSRYRGLEDR